MKEEITKEEAGQVWTVENMHTFNERAPAETLYYYIVEEKTKKWLNITNQK